MQTPPEFDYVDTPDFDYVHPTADSVPAPYVL